VSSLALIFAGCTVGGGEAGSFLGTGRQEVKIPSNGSTVATIRAGLSKGTASCALVDPTGRPAAALPLEATSEISTSVTLTPVQGTWTFVCEIADASGWYEVAWKG